MEKYPAQEAQRKQQQLRPITTLQTGSALVETAIIMPILLLLTLGAIQWAFIYEAKATLNYATFMAARAGSVNHAEVSAIRKGLAKGLIPLFSPEKNIDDLATTYVKVKDDVRQNSIIRILGPSKEAFRDFGVFMENSSKKEIPNERLHLASSEIGSASGVNLQDANLLKLEITYGYKLKVPFIGPVIISIAKWFTEDSRKQELLEDNRLPVMATSIVRMQSRARYNDLILSRNEIDNELTRSEQPTKPTKGSEPGHRPWQPDPTDDGNTTAQLPTDDVGEAIPSICEALGTCDETSNGNPEVCKTANTTITSQSTGIQSVSVANPVHVVTGNKYQQETDISILPGKSSLRFIRHYNSQTTNKGILGYGWTYTYDVKIIEIKENQLLVRQSDGRVIRFNKNKNGLFKAQLAVDGAIKKRKVGYDWNWPHGQTLRFTADGRLKWVTEQDGSTMTLHYSADHYLYKVTDPQQRSLSFQYNNNAQLQVISDPAGQKTRYQYDRVGNLLQVTYPDQTTRHYHYEDKHDRHNLTGITDGRGIRYATYGYDNRDRAILSTHANNVQKVTLQYEPGKTLVTNSKGITSTYHTQVEDGISMVTQIDGPGCSTCGTGDVKYTYNKQFQITEITSKNSITTKTKYDTLGRVTKIFQQDKKGQPQLLTTYEYNGDSKNPIRIHRPSINTQGKHTVHITYNSKQQVSQIKETGYSPVDKGPYRAITRTTQLHYRGTDLTAIDGPRTDVKDITQITYTRDHLIKTIINPDETIQEILKYDRFGRPLTLQSHLQEPIHIQYDARGRISKTRQGLLATTYRYNALGRLEQITGTDGTSYQVHYDNAGRATEIKDPQGNAIAIQWDTENNLVRQGIYNQQGQMLQTLAYVYDAQDRLQDKIAADGHRLLHNGYDDSGRLTHITNAKGHTTAIQYSHTDRIQSLIQPGSITTHYGYDEKGRFSTLTDTRNNTNRHVKDDFGNTIRIDSPDTGTTRFEYDKAGNTVRKTDAKGQVTQYRYDAAGHLVAKSNPDAPSTDRIRYEYQNGKLSQIVEPNSSEAYSYNRNGQLTRHTRVLDQYTYTTSYLYDDATGKLKEKTLPDGQTLRYHYNKANGKHDAITRKNLIGQTTIMGEIEYRPFGPVKAYTHGNGIKTRHQYNHDGALMSIQTEKIQRLEYQYDETGNITGIKQNNIMEQYKYDPSNRLVQAKNNTGRYTYSYDTAGNRMVSDQVASPTRTAAYQYDPQSNRLASTHASPTTGYQYDATGNPVRIGKNRYDYNRQHRLTRFYNERKLKAEYEYNAKGERTRKTIQNNGKKQVTYYLYEQGKLSAEINAKGKIIAQYLYMGHKPIALLLKDDIYAIHTNHLGTPRTVTDEDGDIVWQADYAPFGKAYIRSASITMNLRLPGQYYDSETGLHYNYFRYYDPQTGRYITSDPIGLRGGLNTYGYAGGDPLGAIDPLGLKVWIAEKAINGLPLNAGALGGHTWIIIEPDSISELETLGYDRLRDGLVGGRLALRAGPSRDPNTGSGVGPAPYGWLVADTVTDSTTVWRQLYDISPPEYGQSTSCMAISADSLFIRDILEAYVKFNDSYYSGTKYVYDGFAGSDSDAFGNTTEYYNSNSFTVGILIAAGIAAAQIPDPWGITPGIYKPVPISSTFDNAN